MPNTDLGYLDFRLLAHDADFRIFENHVAEMGCVHTTPEATNRSGAAFAMVSKKLKKQFRVRKFFIDRNRSYLPGRTADFRFVHFDDFSCFLMIFCDFGGL